MKRHSSTKPQHKGRPALVVALVAAVALVFLVSSVGGSTLAEAARPGTNARKNPGNGAATTKDPAAGSRGKGGDGTAPTLRRAGRSKPLAAGPASTSQPKVNRFVDENADGFSDYFLDRDRDGRQDRRGGGLRKRWQKRLEDKNRKPGSLGQSKTIKNPSPKPAGRGPLPPSAAGFAQPVGGKPQVAPPGPGKPPGGRSR